MGTRTKADRAAERIASARSTGSWTRSGCAINSSTTAEALGRRDGLTSGTSATDNEDAPMIRAERLIRWDDRIVPDRATGLCT